MKDHCEDEIPLNFSRRQVVGRPKKMAAPGPPHIPRIARLMALAIKFQDMIERGEVHDYADIARLGYVTRARLTQIMNLTLLSPQVQEMLLMQNGGEPNRVLREHDLRAIAAIPMWEDQIVQTR